MSYPMRDLNNPVFVAPYSPEAEWKRTLLIDFSKRFNLDTFVETGTCWGDTVEAVIPYFRQIYSIELSPVFYHSAVRRFQHQRHVHLMFGESKRTLEDTLHQITTDRILFWLDAHVTGGPSADAGNQVPSELAIIDRLAPNALVLIDDVKPDRCAGYEGPDGQLGIPDGWHCTFLSGVLILHRGTYEIPERF